MIRLCFVCLGNICRSPTAEGIFRSLASARRLDDRILVDSAGTGDWHVGEPPDPRTRATAKTRGLVLDHRAQQFVASFFDRFDYVVAMDRANARDLTALARTDAERAKVSLLRDYDASSPVHSDVPDPYYGGPHGFEDTYDVCRVACEGLLTHLLAKHGLA